MDPIRPLNYAQAHRQMFVGELKDFIRFPTISAQPKHADDVKKCASRLAGQLCKIGMPQVRVFPTRGNPIVYATWTRAPAYPTYSSTGTTTCNRLIHRVLKRPNHGTTAWQRY
jgi:acetylornithine deacetylase/succinyl-diaminopimelate desuccinylase-like protein